MESEQDNRDELRRFFAALSDETRLKVAASLVDEARAPSEIAAMLSLPDRVVTRCLSMLVDAGVVAKVDHDGSPRYCFDVERLRERRKSLLTRPPSTSDASGASESDLVVLARFLDGERLKDIPVDRRKRLVVLAWLASQFDEERRYPEREVNEIIKRHHPDASALRRYLVDERLMQREAGVYWRVPKQPAS